MSAVEILEQFRKLPFKERREVAEQILDEVDSELTPEQIAELERRAKEAFAHPERCIPWEDVVADIEKTVSRQAMTYRIVIDARAAKDFAEAVEF